MATFEETVLGLSPILFWRCKDLSPSTQITDYSGNDFHGSVVSGSVIVGSQSLIETDVDARSVYTPGGFANNIAEIASPPPADLLFTGNFSIGCFIIHEQQSGFQYLMARGGSAGSTGAGLHFYTSGNTTRTLFGSFVTWDGAIATVVSVQAESTHLNGANYFFVFTRNGNVARLYRNGALVGEETGGDTNPLRIPASNPVRFGAGGNNLGPLKGYGAELMIFTYALTAGEVLDVFESSKLVLPLSATIYVRFPVELETDQIIPVDFPFTHNFADAISGQPNPLIEVLSYKTNVNQSEPDYQQRVNAQPHHVERILEYHVTSIGLQRSRLQAALWTPGDVYKLPIANDWGPLTAEAAAGASTLSLDTTLRDYEIGSHVAVWESVFDASTCQFFEITSRTDTEMGITPDVGTTIPIGSPVMPARLACLPDEDLSVKSHMIDRETAVLQFEVLSTELSSRRVTAYTPSATYLSIEVFSLERAKVEWLDPVSIQIGRRMLGPGTPTGNDYQRALDTGSTQTIPIRVLLTTRQAISEFHGWMDARQGKQNPVWLVGQDADLDVVGRTITSITITYIGYTARYNVHSARRHIAFLKTDGTYTYKTITNAVDNGDGTETLSISSPPTLATIVKTSFLRFCTAPDRFELRYHRSGSGFIAECEFVMTELLTTPE